MNILVGVDFAPSSATVLKKAAEYAARLDAKLWLLHVAEPDPDFVGYDVGPQEVRDILSTKYHHEHKQLQTMADDIQASGQPVEALLVQGSVASTIVKEAEKLDAEMIIVGSHGHGAMHHLLLGSVSEGVVHKAKCPVLVVPTHGRE